MHALKKIALTGFGLMFAAAVFADSMPEIQFDGRAWQVGYKASNENQSIVEYVVNGEKVDHWSELVTVNFNRGLQNVTPQEYLEKTRSYLQSICGDAVEWKVIRQTDSEALYEWTVKNCKAVPDQTEIARFATGKEGMYILHYASKAPDLSLETKSRWHDIFSKTDIR